MFLEIAKIIQIVCYFLQKAPDCQLNYTKILKLIFFADKYHLRKYGNLITNDTYYAMKFGPVASCTYDLLKNPEDLELHGVELPFQKNDFMITLIKKVEKFDYLSCKEQETLDLIFQTFGSEDWKDLVEDTHQYLERLERYDAGKGRVNMNIMDFFKNSPQQHSIFDASLEELELTKDLYEEKLEYAL